METQHRSSTALRAALVVIALVLVGLEAGTRLLFVRASAIERRIAGEHQAALAMRRPEASAPPSILLLGNSLLLSGVDVPRLRVALDGKAQIERFVIENTTYYDWYYGMRALLASGARPSTVLLCLNLPQLVTTASRGDFSSYYLFGPRDIPEISRTLHYNLTAGSSLLLAHYSLYYAERNNIRSFVIQQVYPEYAQTAHDLVVRPRTSATVHQEPLAMERLAALRQLTEDSGVTFGLLIPPGAADDETAMLRASHTAGVTAIVPVPAGRLGADYFPDGLHLDRRGAAIFTDALAHVLAARLDGARVRNAG